MTPARERRRGISGRELVAGGMSRPSLGADPAQAEELRNQGNGRICSLIKKQKAFCWVQLHADPQLLGRMWLSQTQLWQPARAASSQVPHQGWAMPPPHRGWKKAPLCRGIA